MRHDPVTNVMATVIPTKAAREELVWSFHLEHDTHPHYRQQLFAMRQYCWWPGIAKDIREFEKRCECSAWKTRTHYHYGPLNLRDRPPLWILKSTATALYHNSHTRPAQDHNSALLLLLQSLNLRHRSYRYSYKLHKLHILMHARSNLTYDRRVKFTLQLPFR